MSAKRLHSLPWAPLATPRIGETSAWNPFLDLFDLSDAAAMACVHPSMISCSWRMAAKTTCFHTPLMKFPHAYTELAEFAISFATRSLWITALATTSTVTPLDTTDRKSKRLNSCH